MPLGVGFELAVYVFFATIAVIVARIMFARRSASFVNALRLVAWFWFAAIMISLLFMDSMTMKLIERAMDVRGNALALYGLFGITYIVVVAAMLIIGGAVDFFGGAQIDEKFAHRKAVVSEE